ncbi:MAG: sigma-54-dependent Fis family transcriptional regulator [Deltaproteobacteria bacterium]|nr:sigma-54-dependent Fis family transcriptional regulator [Deltaproteobacteria bacterium]
MQQNGKQKQLLIIDDEDNMRHMLSSLLSRHGYQIENAADGLEGIALLRKKEFEFVLCDIRMPRMDGMAFLREARDIEHSATIIMMSAYGTVDAAIKAMKLGAYDYISKPFKADEILLVLKKAEERERLKKENDSLRRQLAGLKKECGFGRMVGKSKIMQDMFSLAAKVAQHTTTVLITGESGTGKELVARGIHDSSPRSAGPFVAVNCGGIPENLLESEFFGYKKGAFTGADRNKKGLFAEANGGTLFLDEIGELPLLLQVKLLRVLQEGEIRPIGSSGVEKIDVRIIAATAKNLAGEVEAGRFREDLFYRLNVVHVTVPPLRERKEDIPLLCDCFLKKYNIRLQSGVQGISPAALRRLIDYTWPGNVRELENTMERTMIFSEKKIILPEDLPHRLAGIKQERRLDDFFHTFSLKKAQKQLERSLILRTLEATGGNKSKAAGLLEISYPSLLKKIKDYSLPQANLPVK